MGYFPGVGGNLNTNFPKIQMPRGGGEILKLRFEWYISLKMGWKSKLKY